MMEAFSIHSEIMGYHEYKLEWNPIIAEELQTRREPSLVAKLPDLNTSSDHLIHLQLTQAQCDIIEAATRNQSTNPLWYEQRKGRITASKCYRVCTRADKTLSKKNVNASNLVNEVMGYNKPIQTIAMKHGLAMEPHAKRKLVEVLKDQKHVKVCSGDAGIFVSPNYPHLGASPDIIISWCFP